ncbi:amidohydrolase [Flavobacteriaceae bacterium AU392]|nr:amidohydrolase [Flavobacteriaceae bacterium]RKM85827.1 amidohydrolase [Flavobacteriaceae bacterium AU392]
MLEKVKALRRELHTYPELSGQEVETARRIREFIKTHHDTKIIEELGGTGVAAIYEYEEQGPTVMIRCELDALPIAEPNAFNYKSTSEGVSHKCGHDGHMAMVAGLIFWLRTQTNLKGKVILLFQPAEETGRGAEAVLKDPRFSKLQPDYIFALHNIPGAPMHQIIPIQNNFSPAVQSIAIYLNGKVSHACEPERGINPALAISKIVTAFEDLNIRDPKDEDFTLFTPVYITMGEVAYGISAGTGEVHYTFRTWKEDRMTELKTKINQILENVSISEGITCTIDWFDYFPASINNNFCNEIVIKSAKQNGFYIQENAQPFKFGEDFGWFSQDHQVAMFGLGSGIDTPALHHADYDFPEELLETGMQMFKGIIKELLS